MKRLLSIYLVLILLIHTAVYVQATEPGDDDETDGTTEAVVIQTTEYPDEPTRQPDLASEAAIVMDAKTGTVLYDKNAYIPEYPASITKIMTCLLALENTAMGDVVTFSQNAVYSIGRDTSNVGIKEGEIITVEECLKALMIESANEAAVALAEKISGSEEAFAELMNERAAQLGCRNTHFVNAHGLHDANHYTCAYDMSLILRAALAYPSFRSLSAMNSGEISTTNLTDEVRPLWNALKMIRPSSKYYYEYMKGGKTGYTTEANCTLATFAQKGEMELICITLNCASRKNTYSDTKAIFDYCFNNFSYTYPLENFSFGSGDHNDNIVLSNFYKTVSRDLLNLSIDKDFCLVLNNSIDAEAVSTSISYTQGANTGTLGQLEFTYNGEVIGSTSIEYKAYGMPSTEGEDAVIAANAPVTEAPAENTAGGAQAPTQDEEGGTQAPTDSASQAPANTEAPDTPSAKKKKSKGAGSAVLKFLLILVVLFFLYIIYINIVRYFNRLHRRRRRQRRRRRRFPARR